MDYSQAKKYFQNSGWFTQFHTGDWRLHLQYVHWLQAL